MNNVTKFRRPIIAGLFVTGFILSLVFADQLHATTVRLNADPIQIEGGEFSVDLLVDAVSGLYGIAADLTYDPAFLEVVDLDANPANDVQPLVSEGTFLNADGLEETFLRSALEDDAQGRLVLGLSRSSGAAGVDTTTDKLILSVTFRARQAGTTSISFDKPALKDSSNVDIAVDAWNGVTLDINEGPDISVSPVAGSFGEIALGGQTAPVTFTITNVSQPGQSIDLALGTLLITGTDPDDFLILNDICSGQSLPGSNSCTLDVLFAPAAAGARSANLSIPSNDGDTPTYNVPLDGTGVSTLMVTLDPETIGTVTGPGIDCPIDCTENYNLSGQTVQLTASAVTEGYHFSNWSGDISGTDNPTTVSVDTNMNVTAHFQLDTYTITATAVTGGTISPSGAVSVTHGSNITFTITADLGYLVTDVIVDLASAGVFPEYTFSNVTADHTIEALFVVETFPDISIAPLSHYFGLVDPGVSSPVQTFTVSNTGLEDLHIGTVTTIGANAAEFGIPVDLCSSVTVAPSGSCTVDVVFSPASVGTKSAALSVPSDDPDTPMLTAQLTGASGCIKGDVNDDHLVNVLDSILVVRIVTGEVPSPTDICTADVDDNATVDILDVIMILMMSL